MNKDVSDDVNAKNPVGFSRQLRRFHIHGQEDANN